MAPLRNGAVALAIALALVAACRRPPARVVIGVALPQDDHKAVALAIQEINAAGGIHGVPLEAMGMGRDWRADSIGDFEASLGWCNTFANMPELLAVVGPSDSSSTLTVAATLNRRHVPEIVTSATNASITSIGDWVYRLCISDAVQGPALADYAARDWHKKRAAIFHVNDDYGRGLAQKFEERWRALGGEVVVGVPHRNTPQADDRALIEATLSDLRRDPTVDLLVLFQRQPAARFTIETIRRLGLSADILGGDNLLETERFRMEKASSPGLLEGIRTSAFYWPDPSDPRLQAFIRAYRGVAGIDPADGQAFSYDAVHLVKDAVLAGGFSRSGVKAYLDRMIREQTVVKGRAGTYRLGRDHDGRRSIYILETHDGAPRLLKTLVVN
jgi:branched-chain amino acid transport system substrate-binding protein